MGTTPVIAANLTDQQRAIFYAQLPSVQKDEVVGVLMALFLGAFGAHHFYLRRNVLGILYVLFFWTGITAIIGVIECFFMPGRVRQYNAEQAALLAANLQYAVAGTPVTGTTIVAATCSSCGAPLVAGVKFCSRCGASIAH
ncbi:MAG TPA: NINE protein [Pseudacidobacterium sp.]|nr:NINE protein [Pseudacidobacterium sp.]